jgi:hypothetical protein
MKRKVVLLFAVAMLMITLAATDSHAQNARALIGKWFFEEGYYGAMSVIEFTQTQWSFFNFESGETGTFPYQADEKTIDMDGWLHGYTIQNGNVLRLIDEFGLEFIGKKLQANATSLTGRYKLANDVGFFEILEFIDSRTVAIHAEMLGITSRTVFNYRISGPNLIISNSDGSLLLEIIGDRIIMGNILGITSGEKSVFIKN